MAVFKFRNLTSGQATAIPPGAFMVGRSEDAYVIVEDTSVSRHHARLVNDDSGLYLEDLGSANGVAVHGTEMKGRALIKAGDLVRIGNVSFRVDPDVPDSTSQSIPTPPRTSAAAPPSSTAPVQDSVVSALPDPSPTRSGSLQAVRITMRRESGKLAQTAGRLPRPNLPHPESAALEPASPTAHPIVVEEPTPPFASAPPLQNGARTATGTLIRKSVPLPTLARLTATLPSANAAKPVADSLLGSTPVAAPGTGTVATPVPAPAPTASAPTSEEGEVSTTWWFITIFLAGLGCGLLFGLFFARLFFEMGGHPSALP